MRLILQDNVEHLGSVGDVVNVKDGFGRNYLLPRGLAVIANEKNVKELEHQKRVVEIKKTRAKKKFEDMATKLSEVSITIERETSEEEKLFGSVTTMDITAELSQRGFAIDRHNIKLAEPIKRIGEYEVEIKLPMQVTGKIKVWVVKK
ncbi:MAG: 50S ribosomal protein L9 [Pseudomonadota bacterium]